MKDFYTENGTFVGSAESLLSCEFAIEQRNHAPHLRAERWNKGYICEGYPKTLLFLQPPLQPVNP